MSREQIDGLMADRKSALASQTPPPAGHGTPTAAPLPVAEQPPPAASSTASARPPLLPARIEQLYEVSSPSGSDSLLIPHLLGRARVHFVDSKSSVDLWQDVERVVRLGEDIPADIWAEADTVPPGEIRTTSQAPASARWEPLPAAATDSTSYTSWKRDLKDDLYRNQRLTLFCCPSLKLYSTPDETRDLFTARVRLRERELRDEQKDKLREKFASKIRRQQERVRSAESRQSVEEEQASSATTSAWLSTVTSALGVLFGRKWTSVGNVSRAGTAARAHQRASKQRSDIERARQKVEQEREELEELERELETELKQLTEAPPTADIEEYLITPRKSDLDVQTVALLWRPAGR